MVDADVGLRAEDAAEASAAFRLPAATEANFQFRSFMASSRAAASARSQGTQGRSIITESVPSPTGVGHGPRHGVLEDLVGLAAAGGRPTCLVVELVVIIRQPSFSWPTRFDTGTRTSS